MSISTVRNIIEKPTCAIGCAAVMTVAVAVGLFQAQCGDPRANNKDVEAVPIAKVGDFEITYDAVDRRYTQQSSMYSQLESMPPTLEASLLGSTLRDLVDTGVMLQLAKQRGVAATRNTAEAAIESMWQQQVGAMRESYEMLGRVKPGATPKEFEDAYLKESGRSLAQQREEFRKAVMEAVEDESRRDEVLAELSRPALLESFRREMQIPDAELRTLDDNWRFKRIIIRGQDEAAVAQARKALEDIRGGMSFENAMTKYSVEPPLPNKKVSENETALQKRLIHATPAYAPLLRLKTGEVSEPIVLPEGTVIFKLLGVTPNPPKDFEQNKAQIRSAFERSLAQTRLQQELDNARKQAKVEWESQGYEALYRYAALTQEAGGPTGQARTQRLAEIERFAAEAAAQDPIGARAAALARYLANTDQYGPEPTAELIERRIAAVQGLLNHTHSIPLILELVDLYIEQKDGQRASEQLLQAARSNHNFSPEGQQQYQTVADKLELLRSEKMIQPEAAKQLDEELQRWRREKLEMEKAQAEQKKLDEAAAKRAAEEEKKMQEEARKAEEAAKKAGAAQPAPPLQKTTGG